MSLQNSSPSEDDRQQARLILQTVLMSALSLDRQQWLSDQLSLVAIEKSNRSVDMAFGLCPRRLGCDAVTLTNLQQAKLNQLMPGWDVRYQSVDALARILVLSCFEHPLQLAEQLGRLLRHSDLKEQLALYRGLPLYPSSDALNDCLADGLRSNMSKVFEAIAHGNPYPAWYLDTHRFNHMVLKALFIDSTLSPIVGLDERNNAELARMLLDTARERRAAGRSVSEELWRTAMPFMTQADLQEFNRTRVA